jgi:hypothetical protein
MLTAGELDGMRATAQTTMVDTATVLRPTLISDPYGGSTTTYATVTTLPVRIGAGGPRTGSGGVALVSELPVGARLVPQAEIVATVPAGSDVRPTDRLVIQQVTYDVVGITPETYQTGMRVSVRRSGAGNG